MKKLIPLLSAILLSHTPFAQSDKFKFQFGDEYELPRNTQDLAFFGNNEDGLMNLALKKDELTILRFDPISLKKLTEETVTLNATPDFNSEIFFNFANGDTYWLHSDWNKQNEIEYLHYQKLDLHSTKFNLSFEKLLQTKRLVGDLVPSGNFYRAKLINKYNFAVDESRRVLVVSYTFADDDKKNKSGFSKIGVEVFDDKMIRIWGNEFTMPYETKKMSRTDLTVDSKGNVYCLVTAETIEKTRKTKAEYKREIFRFSAGNKKIEIIPVPKSQFEVTEYSLNIAPGDKLMLTGIYSKSGGGNVGGFFVLPVQPGVKKQQEMKYIDFPKSEMAKFMTPKDRSKLEKEVAFELPNLRINDLEFENDGSILLVCEDRSVATYSNSRTTMSNYFAESILAARINPSHKLEWVRKIPKYQRSNKGFAALSFKLITDATGYYFLYLDNLKNMNLSEDMHPEVHWDISGGQFVVAKITKEGKVTKQIMFDRAKEDIRVFPREFLQVGESRFLGRAQLKKTLFQPLLIAANNWVIAKN